MLCYMFILKVIIYWLVFTITNTTVRSHPTSITATCSVSMVTYLAVWGANTRTVFSIITVLTSCRIKCILVWNIIVHKWINTYRMKRRLKYLTVITQLAYVPRLTTVTASSINVITNCIGQTMPWTSLFTHISVMSRPAVCEQIAKLYLTAIENFRYVPVFNGIHVT